MRIAGKILLAVGLTVAFGAAVVWSWVACGPRSVAFALLFVWLTTCWTILMSFAIPFRLPAAWFELRSWEQDGRCYARTAALQIVPRGSLSLWWGTGCLRWLEPVTRHPRGLASWMDPCG